MVGLFFQRELESAGQSCRVRDGWEWDYFGGGGLMDLLPGTPAASHPQLALPRQLHFQLWSSPS